MLRSNQRKSQQGGNGRPPLARTLLQRLEQDKVCPYNCVLSTHSRRMRLLAGSGTSKAKQWGTHQVRSIGGGLKRRRRKGGRRDDRRRREGDSRNAENDAAARRAAATTTRRGRREVRPRRRVGLNGVDDQRRASLIILVERVGSRSRPDFKILLGLARKCYLNTLQNHLAAASSTFLSPT